MEQSDLLILVAVALERLGIPYLITGSMASIAYGEPRFTHDIDVVVDLEEDQVKDLKACFPEADFYFSEDAARAAISRRLQFNIIHPGSGLKVDLIISKRDEFDRSRFGRPHRLPVGGDTGPTSCPPKMSFSRK